MKSLKYTLAFLAIASLFTRCAENKNKPDPSITQKENISQFKIALQKHLDAVEQKDTVALAKTLAPKTSLYFLQPQRELSTTSASFMDFHTGWFKGATQPWSISFKILHTEVSNDLGIAVVECLYEEPDRDGKPYFNRLHVTYAQKRINTNWYVLLDHAASIEKSTD